MRREIEELRLELNEKFGGCYDKERIQAAGAESARLDDLIARWLSIQVAKADEPK